jgi:hypothetical protein
MSSNSGEGSNEQKFSHTVMPKEDNATPFNAKPGIAVPKNAEEIKEFSEIRNVDARALNEEIDREEQALARGERSQAN